MVRLDRALASLDWEEQFPACHLQALGSDASDHCTLLLQTDLHCSPKPRFHFEIFWPKFSDYQEALQRGWSGASSIADPIVKLDFLLRELSKELRSWAMRRIGLVREQLLMARAIILRLDQLSDSRNLSDSERQLRSELKHKCLGLSSLDRNIARQRVRVRHLAEGDANTKYFHLLARGRRRRNVTTWLKVDEAFTSSHQAMEKALFDHFSRVFGITDQLQGIIDFQALGFDQRDLAQLE